MATIVEYVAPVSFGLFVFLITLLITFVRQSFKYWEKKGVYTLPIHPLFGTAKDLITQKKPIAVEIKDFYNAYKAKGLKYGGYYVFMKPIFIPVDNEVMKKIIITDFNHFTDHAFYLNEEKEPLSAHLFALRGKRWYELRRKITATFTNSKIKAMFPIIVECVEILNKLTAQLCEEKKEFTVKELMSGYTLDNITSCAFGLEIDAQNPVNQELYINCAKFFSTTIKNSIIQFISFLYPQLLSTLGINFVEQDIYDFFEKLVKSTVEYREKTNTSRKDLLQSLIQLKNNGDCKDNKENQEVNGNKEGKQEMNGKKEETTITFTELAAQCFVVFLAGYETTSTLLTFLMYELALDLEIQNKVREEIEMVLEKYDNKITYDALGEMPYLDKVIKETLRKYPPLPVVTRYCTKDYKIPDTKTVISKGTCVFLPIMGIHYDPEFYPDPDKFDPERYSEENKLKGSSLSWIPFGEGPRICIGMNFALVQAKAVLAVLFKNYSFTFSPKFKLPMEFDTKLPFTLNSKDPILLDIKKVEKRTY